MFCNACGTRNAADSKYCKECGAKLDVAKREIVLPAQDLEGVVGPARESLIRMLDMAFWHNQAGNTGAAMRACESALSINPQSATAHSLLGCLYEKQGRDEKAIEHFETVLALNPESNAEREKLAQIRRGLHVPPQPEPLNPWLPPVISTYDWKGLRMRMADRAAQPKDTSWLRAHPGVVTAVVGVAVFAAGAIAILRQDGASTPSAVRPVQPLAASTPAPVSDAAHPSVAGSAWADSSKNSDAAPVGPPVTLTPAPAKAFDPFAGGSGGLAEVQPAPAWLTLPKNRTKHKAHPLPDDLTSEQMNLQAVPLPPTVPPAPVTMPVPATVENLPQHTVVVSQLAPPAAQPAAASEPAAPDDSDSGDSHIRITVTKGAPDDGAPSAPAAPAPTLDEAASLQQSAVGLQEQGDYHKATAAYLRAMRAYSDQIASGVDVSTAQRGLEACKTGLQICQESQP